MAYNSPHLNQSANTMSDAITEPEIKLAHLEQAINEISDVLYRQGVLVTAIRPPTVPEGEARLRVTLSASHSVAHVEALLAVLADIQQEFGE